MKLLFLLTRCSLTCVNESRSRSPAAFIAVSTKNKVRKSLLSDVVNNGKVCLIRKVIPTVIPNKRSPDLITSLQLVFWYKRGRNSPRVFAEATLSTFTRKLEAN